MIKYSAIKKNKEKEKHQKKGVIHFERDRGNFPNIPLKLSYQHLNLSWTHQAN